MAWRVKYRVAKVKKHVALDLLGVHAQNRAGVYPNADRVEGLGTGLLKDGFSIDEADHEGVCVQEVPMAVRMKDPAVAGLLEFNKDKCTDPLLQVCFQEQTDTLYGTLSHSHLLLVLLSFLHGASWKVPEEFRGLLNKDGGWNFPQWRK